MRKILKPDFSVSDVLAAASSSVRSDRLKAKLGAQPVKDRLVAAESAYENAAAANQIYMLPKSDDVVGILDRNESIKDEIIAVPPCFKNYSFCSFSEYYHTPNYLRKFNVVEY